MKILVPLMAASLTASVAGQVFRSGTEAVRIDVLVTDGRRPVAGLTAADFSVRDSGVPQRIDSVTLGDVPLSVMFVLDVSFSMRDQPLTHLKEAAAAVVDLLAPADRAAVLTFSQVLALRSGWTSDRAALKASIAPLAADGSTSLHDAAYTALTLRDPARSRPLVLIFSDGDDTISWLPGPAVLDRAQWSEAVVYGVGLKGADREVRPGYRLDLRSGLQPVRPKVSGPTLLEEFLPTLATDTGGKYLTAERSDQLRDAFVEIVTEFRTRYLLTYTPQGVDKRGWHPLKVELTTRRGEVTARRGYLR